MEGNHDEDSEEKTSEESQSDGYDDVKRRCYNIEFPKTVITQLETSKKKDILARRKHSLVL